MGFRFQRRIRIAPGVRLNLSRSGISTSVGGRGFTLNSRGTATVGIPGTGLSYRANLNAPADSSTALAPAQAAEPVTPGRKRIVAGVVFCLMGAVVPVLSVVAIPCFISGFEARYG
jgi:hypothetical protein